MQLQMMVLVLIMFLVVINSNYNADATSDDGSCEFISLADAAPLFFSEYAEGSSNNKYLEIFNPTMNHRFI